MEQIEKNKIINSLLYPLLFILIIGLIHLIQFVFEVSFVRFGVFPRSIKGLIGIVSSPLIHGDYNHLLSNSIPLIILGALLFYFYKEVAFKVSVWIYLMVGIWTWVYARESYHIGASGILYGLFSFLLVSGFIRRNKQLIALSFAVIFLYGSLIWGIFPIDIKISFEAHLFGFIAGVILAFYYKKQGLQKLEHYWAEEEEVLDEDAYWLEGFTEKRPKQEFRYTFKANEKDEKPIQ